MSGNKAVSLFARYVLKREREIMNAIETLDASYCKFSLTWRHSGHCSFSRKNKIRVRRTDLEWLAFRPNNRRPKILEISYYRALSLSYLNDTRDFFITSGSICSAGGFMSESDYKKKEFSN